MMIAQGFYKYALSELESNNIVCWGFFAKSLIINYVKYSCNIHLDDYILLGLFE